MLVLRSRRRREPVTVATRPADSRSSRSAAPAGCCRHGCSRRHRASWSRPCRDPPGVSRPSWRRLRSGLASPRSACVCPDQRGLAATWAAAAPLAAALAPLPAPPLGAGAGSSPAPVGSWPGRSTAAPLPAARWPSGIAVVCTAPSRPRRRGDAATVWLGGIAVGGRFPRPHRRCAALPDHRAQPHRRRRPRPSQRLRRALLHRLLSAGASSRATPTRARGASTTLFTASASRCWSRRLSPVRRCRRRGHAGARHGGASALLWLAAWHLLRDAAAAWFGWATPWSAAPFGLHAAAIYPDGPAAASVAAALWLLAALLHAARRCRWPALAFGGRRTGGAAVAARRAWRCRPGVFGPAIVASPSGAVNPIAGHASPGSSRSRSSVWPAGSPRRR